MVQMCIQERYFNLFQVELNEGIHLRTKKMEQMVPTPVMWCQVFKILRKNG
jgi:hypothetical protein